MRHYEESILISENPQNIFAYIDDHSQFSSHMNKSSWMMGGGSMNIKIDDGKGQKIGSHIQMHGKVFKIPLFLDEVITQYELPFRKAWQTVGDINILVIGHYKLGFEIKPDNNNSIVRVYIDFDLPQSFGTRLLSYLLGGIYAKWCVRQMIEGIVDHFRK